MTTTENYKYHSEIFRGIAADSEARGEAQAVLIVLEGRDVEIPDEAREQILACTDSAQLQLWLRRAGTAVTIDDVMAD